MCKYCARTRKWYIFFHTKFYTSHFLNCASENMKLFSNFSSNYSIVLCLFPLFFFKLFSCIVSISTFFFKLFSCIVSIFILFFISFREVTEFKISFNFFNKEIVDNKTSFRFDYLFFFVIPIWAKVHPEYEYDSQWFKNKMKLLLQWEENISEKI